MPQAIARGARLDYEIIGGSGTAGTGTPMVWGHGLTSSRTDEDRLPLVDSSILSLDRSVLRYDARGHGTSSGLETPADGDWAALAGDQIALIDHVGWDEVILGGASMGTATALHAALALGDRVRALVLTIPPTAWETRAAQVELYEQMAVAVERDGVRMLTAALAITPPPTPFAEDGAWIERRRASLEATPPDRLAAAFRGAATADLPPASELAEIRAPTLVLAWTGDPGHPVETANRLGQVLPDAEVVISSTRDDFDTWTTRCAAFLDGR